MRNLKGLKAKKRKNVSLFLLQFLLSSIHLFFWHFPIPSTADFPRSFFMKFFSFSTLKKSWTPCSKTLVNLLFYFTFSLFYIDLHLSLPLLGSALPPLQPLLPPPPLEPITTTSSSLAIPSRATLGGRSITKYNIIHLHDLTEQIYASTTFHHPWPPLTPPPPPPAPPVL